MADHHHQLLRPRAPLRAQLSGRELHSDPGGLPKRTLLLSTQNPCGQPLPPRIREQADQPRPEVISSKRHTPIFPAWQPISGRCRPAG